MRLIDADALKIELAILHGGDYKTIHYLNHARTVDAVPVVRCRECKYAKEIPHVKEWDYSCRYFNTHSVMADDFCSRGERK